MLNRSSALAALWSAAFATLVAAQVSPELREAMRARHEAVWRADAATWDRLTADEFTVVVPDGRLMTKAERLTGLRSENPGPIPVEQQEQIHTYGETVVHRFLDGDEWILEVWVRRNGAWRVVAAQVNLAKK
jgi:hypothetical protein